MIEKKSMMNGVDYQYHPGDKVHLYFALGLKVTVYKPYKYKKTGQKRVYDKPYIALSSNTTCLTALSDITLLYTAIDKAIDILNAEGFNLIDKNFTYGGNYVEDNPFAVVEEELNYAIRLGDAKVSRTYKLTEKNVLISRENGDLLLYLGHGVCLGGPRNRSGCDLLYAQLSSKDTQVEVINGVLTVTTPSFYIDSCCTKKAAIKVERFEGVISSVIVINGEHYQMI